MHFCVFQPLLAIITVFFCEFSPLQAIIIVCVVNFHEKINTLKQNHQFFLIMKTVIMLERGCNLQKKLLKYIGGVTIQKKTYENTLEGCTFVIKTLCFIK